MTPLKLLMDEVQHSNSLKTVILKNVHDKNKKKINFNVTNLIFDFKASIVEIQDEIGITDVHIQRITIDRLVSVLNSKDNNRKTGE